MKAELPFVKQEGFPNSQMQENLVQKINLLTKIPFLSGAAVLSVTLSTGDNKIAHKLQRKYQGWFTTKIDAGVQLYQVAASDDNLYITLNASAPVTIDLWVY